MNDKYIVHFLSKTKKKMTRFIEEKLSSSSLHDLIPTHGNVLTALYENGEKLTMKQIAAIISKDKSTVTPLVNKLVKLGYVYKEKSNDDARVTFIKLTDKGIVARKPYDTISSELNQKAFQGFSDDEKQEFLRLLRKLSMNFSEK